MNIQALRINAIGLAVTDCVSEASSQESRSLYFYTQVLGFKKVSNITVTGESYSDLENIPESKIRIVTLQLGDELIKLKQYLDLEGKPIPQDSQSNDLWFQHLAIVVSDLDRAYNHLQSFGIEAISTTPQTIPPDNKPAAGIRAFKFKDRDRHNLELIWYPPGKGQDKWHQKSDSLFLGIDHSAITISNTEKSLNFYRDLLGMQVDGGSLNQGETQAHLDGLPEAKVNITALRPVQGGIGIELLDYIVPNNGRAIPSDWKSFDIANMQIELVVNDIEQVINILRDNNIEFVSPQIVQLPDSSTERQACLVKDPDGHTVLIINS